MRGQFTIGQVAKELGINIQTVRFYEKRGLIPKPQRKLSGYRLFTQDTLRRIEFIKKAQHLGFSLKEISDLLKLKVSCSTNNTKIREKAQNKLALIQAKVKQLKMMEKTLKALISICKKQGKTGPCPIINGLT